MSRQQRDFEDIGVIRNVRILSSWEPLTSKQHETRFLKMDIGTKRSVRITMLALLVVEHLFYMLSIPTIGIPILFLQSPSSYSIRWAPPSYFDVSHCLSKGLGSKGRSVLKDLTSVAHIWGMGCS